MSTSDRIVFSPNLKRLNIDDNDDDDEDQEDLSNAKRTKRIDRLNDPGEVHPNSKQYLIYSSGEPSIISTTARFWSLKYLRTLDHINPEIYDVKKRPNDISSSFFTFRCFYLRSTFTKTLFVMPNSN